MISFFNPLREFTIYSVVFRLILSVILGFFIGFERESKHLPAGLRTYILVCIGSTLTMILSQYEYDMLQSAIQRGLVSKNVITDVSRFGAQVINGIGFLAAGTIIINAKQEVKGITTAASLWASACMGLCIGAGFYECVFLGFLTVFICNRFLPILSNYFVKNSCNMNIYVEFNAVEEIREILLFMENKKIRVYDFDLERGDSKRGQRPSAVMLLRLNEKSNHTSIISEISSLKCINLIDEI
ncbi:MgtC/SapB family protein [Criibacterium bergeronii]|uniref:MgtC/SapB family protein n=1 Tax=Criibacterium bergeronii TaxID=1871336 RepID=A0A371INX4_9FIRM|nr:MgtC/SapB family protein [Criibacterium bergeronii]RDY22192.1 MgtC/SapB family protein [Criibacterium bergeronii]TRW28693.1 MgtC/SapB family protein [Criibacterium bergeronii]